MSQEPSSSSSPSPPSSNATKPDPLLRSIRSVVTLTNSALAQFEQSTVAASSSLLSRLSAISHQGRLVASRAMAAYDHRGYYGPQIVVASTLAGGAAGMTRGRASGIVAGGLAGLLAYENVYGFVSGEYGESWREKMRRASG
ncbi:hypothetical protein HJC23_011820 [Cyclotella cryptica]|uniref:Uncharacterized protein n=1 Tax=Cyclotella cryptica TaxID=29204 RepID=A0ABD3NVR5_9STRA|eukprot:CCRYP_019324-RA/>CCRYP_019324-RA protein AED:0.38 eAED:0.38 QI:0/-1/0/1/-1/1/1/0/141